MKRASTQRESLHQSLEVIHRTVDEFPTGDLHYAFFQVAYIVAGSGWLGINGRRIHYRQGNLMLLTPDDRHHFTIESPTEFLLIRFSHSYIKEYRWSSIDHLECLLYYASHLSGCVLHNTVDYPLVNSLVASILHSIKHGGVYNDDLTAHFVNALIVIAARNIAIIKPAGITTATDKRILEIIDYIQTQIFSPAQLRAPAIAKQFGISGTYLGAYFKEQCGETLQHFISNYKIRLIEHRLRFSDQRINEIAGEFGFSDESHLNKFFKKHRDGLSLTAYRASFPAALSA